MPPAMPVCSAHSPPLSALFNAGNNTVCFYEKSEFLVQLKTPLFFICEVHIHAQGHTCLLHKKQGL